MCWVPFIISLTLLLPSPLAPLYLSIPFPTLSHPAFPNCSPIPNQSSFSLFLSLSLSPSIPKLLTQHTQTAPSAESIHEVRMTKSANFCKLDFLPYFAPFSQFLPLFATVSSTVSQRIVGLG
jgi:hypothetical protein